MTDTGLGPRPAPGRRLTVVHVVDGLAATGGAENRLVDEVGALAPRFDQVVVRLFERGALAPRLAAAGVPVIALGYRARHAGRSWPAIARRLRHVLRDLRPDVVHTSLFTANLVGQLAAARLGVPVVSTFNRTGDPTLQRALQPGMATWRGWAMQRVARRAARRGDVHHRAVSQYARATNCASLGLPVDATTVVPRGVALDELPPRDAGGAPPREGRGGPEFVTTARIVPEKAQHLLVEAAWARARYALGPVARRLGDLLEARAAGDPDGAQERAPAAGAVEAGTP